MTICWRMRWMCEKISIRVCGMCSDVAVICRQWVFHHKNIMRLKKKYLFKDEFWVTKHLLRSDKAIQDHLAVFHLPFVCFFFLLSKLDLYFSVFLLNLEFIIIFLTTKIPPEYIIEYELTTWEFSHILVYGLIFCLLHHTTFQLCLATKSNFFLWCFSMVVKLQTIMDIRLKDILFRKMRQFKLKKTKAIKIHQPVSIRSMVLKEEHKKKVQV